MVWDLESPPFKQGGPLFMEGYASQPYRTPLERCIYQIGTCESAIDRTIKITSNVTNNIFKKVFSEKGWDISNLGLLLGYWIIFS